jgi:5'-3' exonuclease
MQLRINGGPHAIDPAQPILLVDFSYLTFTRFFAIKIWYNASIDNTKPLDYDWVQDSDFMAKYTETYMTRLFAFCKEKKIPRKNIIFALDCSHKANWRVITSEGYKATRAAAHERQGFHNFDIFEYTRTSILAKEQAIYSYPVFSHPHLEADDIIALLVDYYNTINPMQAQLYIMASDRDYVQITSNSVHLYDLSKKHISADLLKSPTETGQLFLIRKILMGDVSDNIPPCYISQEFLTQFNIRATRPFMRCKDQLITKLLTNEQARTLLLLILEDARSAVAELPHPEYGEPDAMLHMPITIYSRYFQENRFIYNARIIDFANIPPLLKQEARTIITTTMVCS